MQNLTYNLKRTVSYIVGFILFYEPFMFFNQIAVLSSPTQASARFTFPVHVFRLRTSSQANGLRQARFH